MLQEVRVRLRAAQYNPTTCSLQWHSKGPHDISRRRNVKLTRRRKSRRLDHSHNAPLNDVYCRSLAYFPDRNIQRVIRAPHISNRMQQRRDLIPTSAPALLPSRSCAPSNAFAAVAITEIASDNLPIISEISGFTGGTLLALTRRR